MIRRVASLCFDSLFLRFAVSVALNQKLYSKLTLMAEKSGRSVDECLELAVGEYVDNYEDVYKTDLNSVNSLERSFFLSIGE